MSLGRFAPLTDLRVCEGCGTREGVGLLIVRLEASSHPANSCEGCRRKVAALVEQEIDG